MKQKVTVFGSFVVDLMARTPHLPAPAETVKGSFFKQGAGGKGFNQGVAAHKEELDALIAQYAIGWNLHRISRFTKAAMRLAIFEMKFMQDVPTGVAINECVELTRKYEDKEVVSFVNGILGSVARGQQKDAEQ